MSANNLSRARREAVIARDGLRCFWCDVETVRQIDVPGSALPGNAFTIDHFVSRSHGGSHELDNLVVACLRCNQDRGDLSANEWMAALDQRSERRCRQIMALALAQRSLDA